MNERAQRRLEMARRLLGLDPTMMLGAVLAEINRLDEKERDSVRSAVDWVEDYEANE